VNRRSGYDESLAATASRIRNALPEDIADLFARCSGKTPVLPVTPSRGAGIAAVDGSNAAVLESGSMTISAVRAGAVLFHDGEIERKRTPLLLVTSGSGEGFDDFSHIYRECFGCDPGKTLGDDERAMLASLARDSLEFWIAGEILELLERGDLLLLDGALRVSHESLDPVLTRLIGQAERKGVLLAALAKRTTATFGDGYPLLPGVAAYAAEQGRASPWWVKVDETILDQTRFSQWQHGEVHVASLHPHAGVPIKVEIPVKQSRERTDQTLSLLAGCADDGRIPGYPFPLLEAHRTVVIGQPVLGQVRQDVIAALDREGIDFSRYAMMFGDYHDEFRRY
jgi:hypothetical protein